MLSVYFSVYILHCGSSSLARFECNSAKEISRTARASRSLDGAIYSRYHLAASNTEAKSVEVYTFFHDKDPTFQSPATGSLFVITHLVFFRSDETAGTCHYFFQWKAK